MILQRINPKQYRALMERADFAGGLADALEASPDQGCRDLAEYRRCERRAWLSVARGTPTDDALASEQARWDLVCKDCGDAHRQYIQSRFTGLRSRIIECLEQFA